MCVYVLQKDTVGVEQVKDKCLEFDIDILNQSWSKKSSSLILKKQLLLKSSTAFHEKLPLFKKY